MNMLKHIAALLLTAVMLISCMPLWTFAAETVEEPYTETAESLDSEATNSDISDSDSAETESADSGSMDELSIIDDSASGDETQNDFFDDDTAVVIASGTCGENLNWTLNSDYQLKVSGTGTGTLPYASCTGYIFDGWYYDTAYSRPVDEQVLNLTDDISITLYSKWNPVTYNISYNSNGGSGTMKSEALVPYDEAFTLRSSTFTKKGYTFAGWNTTRDGSGVSYSDAETVSGITSVDGSTVILYAQWVLTEYKITYELGGATVENSNPVSRDVNTASFTLQTLENDPVLGFFQGWYKDAAFKTKAGTITKGTVGDLTFYAKWGGTTYSISYVLGGNAENINPAGYTSADNVTLAAPVANDDRMGTFLGWYSDPAFKTKVTSIKAGSFGDRVLYAKWKSESYTVTYILNGGTNAKANPKTYTFTTALTELQAPVRKGYTFIGWYTSADFSGEPVTYYGGGMNENLTLYAAWSEDTYKITYVLRGGVNSAENRETYTVNTASFTMKNASRTGYTFSGWYSDASLKTKVTSVRKGSTGNMVLYAKWTQNTYTVAFNGNGKTGGSMSSQTLKYNSAGTLRTNKYTRNGYVFSGWNTAADGTGAYYADEASVMNLSAAVKGKVTLYAQWSPVTYTITYDPCGGILAEGNPETYRITETPLDIASPTREGYTFAGWYKNSKLSAKASYKAGTYGDLILYAKWTPVNYSVSFNGNGSTSGKMSNQKLTYAVSKTLTANAFKRTGYIFAGWNTKPDGSGTAYMNKEAVVSMTAESNGIVTLYAQWTPISYTVILHGNGSTGADLTFTVYYDETFSMPENTFIRVGYGFNGWCTKTSASVKGSVTYAAGAKVMNLTSADGGKVNLYATWYEKEIVSTDDYTDVDSNSGYRVITYADGTQDTVPF